MVLHSQGYRFDFNPPPGGRILTQTGGIFLKASPRQADVYLDGKFIKKTDFFFGSILIENLLPKFYKIRVEKEGYFPWEKTLEVREKEVSEAKLVILIPRDNDFKALAKNVENFWVSPDGKKIIFLELENQSWALKLYDTEKDLKSRLLGEKDISSKGASLLNLEFAPNSKEVFLSAGAKEQEKNFSLKLDKTPPLLSESKTPETPPNAVTVKKTDNNDIYYLDNFGFIFKTDLNFSGGTRINRNPFPIKQETEYQLEVFNNFIFLKEDKSLYLFSADDDSFEKILDDVDKLKISPDEKKLGISASSEIWLFFLEDAFEQFRQKAGEKLFLVRFSQKIQDFFWLNNGYLVFNTGPSVKIIEIDNRDKANIVDLVQFPTPKIFWDDVSEKLYLLSQNSLFVLEKLIRQSYPFSIF
ncbi:MAG: PEGA domain-containing protein [bacterium]|nr:PEGA domain-containing protein [bacterium]